MKLRLFLAALLFPAFASAQTVVFETLTKEEGQNYFSQHICCYGVVSSDGFRYDGPVKELHSVSLWAHMYYEGNFRVEFLEGPTRSNATLLQSWSTGRNLTPDMELLFDPGLHLSAGNNYWVRLSMEYTDYYQVNGQAAMWVENYYSPNESLNWPWSKVFIVRAVPETASLPLILLATALLLGLCALRRRTSMTPQRSAPPAHRT
jgi:hypothetical protein